MKKNFCAFFICLFVFYPNFQNFSFSFIPEKVVALSFDDGPTKYTPEIIEYLKSEKVKATFFIVGNKIEGNETTIKKSIKFKNEIGNHFYDIPF